MGSRNMIGRALAVAGAVAALACFASASASASSGAVPSVAKLVPASIKSGGKLTVATDATYAPDEFVQGTKIVGMDPDLMNALGKVMGLKVTITNVTFDDIITGMVAGRYMHRRLVVHRREVAREVGQLRRLRQRRRVVLHAEVRWHQHQGHQLDLRTDRLRRDRHDRGERRQGAEQEVHQGRQEGREQSLLTRRRRQANLAVSSGRAQLGFADTPVAGYQVKQSHGTFKLVGAAYAPAPYGIAIAKSTGLTKAVQAAMLYLAKHGTYQQIFKKWGLQGIEIPASKVKINGAIF